MEEEKGWSSPACTDHGALITPGELFIKMEIKPSLQPGDAAIWMASLDLSQ